uniref:Polysaccharide chain length determinant N-terminal domain-containing protein n=1 Tax=Phenylobacterium glaciei TaxID=2803784 RepID=A0A974P5R2_9CAUL|nr:hypothetical protein JKL49_11665 [Phenylobacterium glaciei]
MADTNLNERPSGGQPTGVDLSGIVGRYRRHIPLVLAITGVVLAADLGFTLLQKPSYTASATIFTRHVKPKSAVTAMRRRTTTSRVTRRSILRSRC